MKLCLQLCFSLLFLITACAQKERFTTIKEIQGLYGDLIQLSLNVKGKSKEYSLAINQQLPSDHLLKRLGKEYQLFTDYIFWNCTEIDVAKIINTSPDSSSFTKEYIEQLKKDSSFNKNFLPVVYSILKRDHIIITDYEPPEKTRVTEKELIETAGKFFYAYNFDSVNNRLNWHICVGKNPYYAGKSIKRLPEVEAFCFMSLLNNKSYSKKIQKEFINEIKRLNLEVSTINESENKLEYARNEMSKTMSGSKNLKKMILSEYNNKSVLLPFYIE